MEPVHVLFHANMEFGILDPTRSQRVTEMEESQNSALPDCGYVSEIANVEPRMRIYRVALNSFESQVRETSIDMVNDETGMASTVVASVYKVDDLTINGFMPSKVWYDGGFQLLYYVSPSLPDRARPFGYDPCYVFSVCVPDGESIVYDWNISLFIDQIMTSNGMLYLFICSEAELPKILRTQWNGDCWPIKGMTDEMWQLYKQ